MVKHRKYMFILFFCLIIPFSLYAQSDTYQGEKLYELKCGRCHFAYSPQKYSMEEWKTLLKEMGPLSGLNEESEKAILEYLEPYASERKIGDLPTSPAFGGYLYSEFFSSNAQADTFDIHYLNLNVTGRVHERVSYRAEFEFEHGGGDSDPPFVEQAFIDFWFESNMALRIGFNNIMGGFVSALILFLGHALNILLGLMAVIVHGIRLNMLEFSSHLGMQWSGIEYKPFKE